MTDWYKEKNFQFQLGSMEEKMDKKVWPSYEKRHMEFKDQQGNKMEFPMKSGLIWDGTGQWFNVQDCLDMAPRDFKNKFPDFNIGLGVIRDVIVNGTMYKYNFKFSSNKKLNDMIKIARNMGMDPFAVNFKQVFDKTKTANEMYTIEMSQPGQAVQQQQPQQQPNAMTPPMPQPQGSPVPQPVAPPSPVQQQNIVQPAVENPVKPTETPVQAQTPAQGTLPLPQPQSPQNEQVSQSQAQSVQSPQPLPQAPPLQQQGSIPDQPMTALSQVESDVVNAIIGIKAFDLNEADFIQSCVSNGIPETRAKEIYVKAYKKG